MFDDDTGDAGMAVGFLLDGGVEMGGGVGVETGTATSLLVRFGPR